MERRMTESDDGRETAEAKAARVAQVRALRDQVRTGGFAVRSLSSL
jgi:hypothetical protein